MHTQTYTHLHHDSHAHSSGHVHLYRQTYPEMCDDTFAFAKTSVVDVNRQFVMFVMHR